jgi:monoamine oxidase
VLPASRFDFVVEGDHWSLPELLGRGIAPPWVLEHRLGTEGSLGDALDRIGRAGVERDVCREWLVQLWCAEPEALSAAGVAVANAQRRTDPDSFVLAGGYDLVADRLAVGLDVRVGAPADSISWAERRVEVTARGERVRARAAVVTIPPAAMASGRVAFAPALPAQKLEAARSLPSGDALVVAVVLRFPAPESAWCMVVGTHGGLWRATAGSGVLVGWVKGPAAGALRAAGVLDLDPTLPVRPALPWAEPEAVDDVHVADWGRDPLARGGYCYPGSGSGDARDRWAAPLARSLFFAGDATCAPGEAGRVHGAIRSGQRAVSEVLAALAGRGRRVRSQATQPVT